MPSNPVRDVVVTGEPQRLQKLNPEVQVRHAWDYVHTSTLYALDSGHSTTWLQKSVPLLPLNFVLKRGSSFKKFGINTESIGNITNGQNVFNFHPIGINLTKPQYVPAP